MMACEVAGDRAYVGCSWYRVVCRYERSRSFCTRLGSGLLNGEIYCVPVITQGWLLAIPTLPAYRLAPIS